MKQNHLSDITIQKIALEEEELLPLMSQHLSECGHCTDKLKQYKLLIENLALQPVEMLDVDMVQLVMPRVVNARKPGSRKRPWAILAIAVSVIAGIALSLPYLNFLSLPFDRIDTLALTAMLVGFIGCLLFFIWDLYKQYHARLRQLADHTPDKHIQTI